MKKKGKPPMHNEEEVKEIVVVENRDPAAQAIEQEFAQFLGFPDVDQKKILTELARLHRSLRGPEGLLDKGNYSRPFPPPLHQRNPITQSAASAKGQGA
jgi:hypothetical protein